MPRPDKTAKRASGKSLFSLVGNLTATLKALTDSTFLAGMGGMTGLR